MTRQQRIEHIVELFASYPEEIKKAIVTGAVLAMMQEETKHEEHENG